MLMVESEAELNQNLLRWKNRMQAKSLEVNVGKTDVTGSHLSLIPGPGVCGTGVGDNSIKLRMGIEAIDSILKRNRLRWLEYTEREVKEDWVRKCK